jgi:hypothetical protein
MRRIIVLTALAAVPALAACQPGQSPLPYISAAHSAENGCEAPFRYDPALGFCVTP